MAGARIGQEGERNGTTVELEDDLNALFKLPLAEFTVARNALAARLKKAGKPNDAERVKALVKPSISAWAVNQLYWKHKDAFKGLMALGERLGAAQASQLAGKTTDMRELIAARREALSGLARVAAALLGDAGHNATPDTIRRITTTLEALSAYSSTSDSPPPGRLTSDLDPPGFESLAAFIPVAGRVERQGKPARIVPFQPAAAGASPSPETATRSRKARIASAKAALQGAEQALRATRKMAQEAAAVLKKATAYANETERDKREAEKRLEQATAAAEEARRRLQSAGADAGKAAKALEGSERDVENARKELKEAQI